MRYYPNLEYNLVLVYTDLQGTSETDALHLSCSRSFAIIPNQIRPLQNLRYLRLDGRVQFEGDFMNALQDLKWLSFYTSSYDYPANLVLKDLLILEVSGSQISYEWLSTIEVYNS